MSYHCTWSFKYDKLEKADSYTLQEKGFSSVCWHVYFKYDKLEKADSYTLQEKGFSSVCWHVSFQIDT